MAMIGHKQPLSGKMIGHKLPLSRMIGYKMPGAEMPVDVLTRELQKQKTAGGLERVRRNGGWSSLGNYAGG